MKTAKVISNKVGTSRAPLAGAIARLVMATCFAATPLAQAADRTWTGGADSNLSNASNWAGAVAPVSGDSWSFAGSGTGGYTLNNNLTSASDIVTGITFGSGASAYTINGNAFVFTGTMTNNVNLAHTISSNITFSGSSTISQAASSGLNSFGILLSGNLTGSGSITQTGASGGITNLNFSGDNSGFTGSFTARNDSSVRTGFQSASAGSASASWTFNRAVNGGVGINFSNATISFGALSGSGFIRTSVTGTATLEVGALNTDTVFSGKFQQGGPNALLKLNKVGTGTLTLTGANEHLGGTTISAGTLLIGANNVLADSGRITLSGGTLEVGNAFSDTLGVLDVSGNVTIKLGLGSALTFADSSSSNWTGTGLTLVGEFISGSSLRFGASSSALSDSQLAMISIIGYSGFDLDSNGYLTATAIPEPGIAGLLLLGVGGILFYRRGARKG